MTAEHHAFDPSVYWERRLQRFDLSAVGHSGLGFAYNRWLYRVRARVFIGGLVGALLHPLELGALLLWREGPSTEAVICRRTGVA